MSKKKHALRPKYQAHASRLKHTAASKDVARKQEGIWDTLTKQSLDCLGVLTTAMATHPLLRDVEAIAALPPEVQHQLKVTTAELARKTKEMVGKLQAINGAHKGRTGHEKNAEDLNLAYVLHGQYIQWTEEWETTILPLIETITNAFADANQLKVEMVKTAEGELDIGVTAIDPTTVPQGEEFPIEPDELPRVTTGYMHILPDDAEAEPLTASQIGLVRGRGQNGVVFPIDEQLPLPSDSTE